MKKYVTLLLSLILVIISSCYRTKEKTEDHFKISEDPIENVYNTSDSVRLHKSKPPLINIDGNWSLSNENGEFTFYQTDNTVRVSKYQYSKLIYTIKGLRKGDTLFFSDQVFSGKLSLESEHTLRGVVTENYQEKVMELHKY